MKWFFFITAESKPSTLQEVEVPILSNKECQKWIQEAGLAAYSLIPKIMFCAGYKKGGKDACQVNTNLFFSYQI